MRLKGQVKHVPICKLLRDMSQTLAGIIRNDLELLGESATHATGQVFSARRKHHGIRHTNGSVTVPAHFRALGLPTRPDGLSASATGPSGSLLAPVKAIRVCSRALEIF